MTKISMFLVLDMMALFALELYYNIIELYSNIINNDFKNSRHDNFIDNILKFTHQNRKGNIAFLSLGYLSPNYLR